MGLAMIQHSCDCVVMLTASDWYSEQVSNRYHYATRLSRILPVIFVQPDLDEPRYSFEATEFPEITVLRVFSAHGREQTALIGAALAERGCKAPLLWIFNALFLDFYASQSAPLKVFHATEDYFSFDPAISPVVPLLLKCLRAALGYTDLLISVSEAVEASYISNGGYQGERILAENGCDYGFWGLKDEEIERLTATAEPQKRVLYQGGIDYRLNLGLVYELCASMPDWEFVFSGQTRFLGLEERRAVSRLKRLRNTRFTGQIPIAAVRENALSASIGLLPFKAMESNRVLFPLKAFEYVANGLPAVYTGNVESLRKFGELFARCDSAAGVKAAIERLYKTRYDSERLAARLAAAKGVSYDARFARVAEKIGTLLAGSGAARPRADADYSAGEFFPAKARRPLRGYILRALKKCPPLYSLIKALAHAINVRRRSI